VVAGTSDNPGVAAYGPVVLDMMQGAADLAASTKLGN
jgi:hypothetical protein